MKNTIRSPYKVFLLLFLWPIFWLILFAFGAPIASGVTINASLAQTGYYMRVEYGWAPASAEWGESQVFVIPPMTTLNIQVPNADLVNATVALSSDGVTWITYYPWTYYDSPGTSATLFKVVFQDTNLDVQWRERLPVNTASDTQLVDMDALYAGLWWGLGLALFALVMWSVRKMTTLNHNSP